MKSDIPSVEPSRSLGVLNPIFALVLILVSAFTLLNTKAHAETLFGKEGWVFFHQDEEGTKYYYDENSVVTVADARRARYIGVYGVPLNDGFTYGYVVEAEASCGFLFNKIKVLSLQTFGKGGLDDLILNPTPPEDRFSRPKLGSPAYYFVKTMCEAN